MLNGQVWLKCHAVTRENNKHTYHEEVGIWAKIWAISFHWEWRMKAKDNSCTE